MMMTINMNVNVNMNMNMNKKMISTEKIRLELDELHSEALLTRNKSNSARLRLIRLSETAENLRRQAAISVQTGREEDARDLLYQKKKVLKALDKSKARIQLLDELSFKLNEAISAKETLLIDNVASNMDSLTDETSSAVRIVSPRVENANLSEVEILVQNAGKISDVQEIQAHANELDQRVYRNAKKFGEDIAGDLQDVSDVYTSLESITSYRDFIENIDQQLNRIERELETVLRVSSLVLGGDGKLSNLKVQQTLEILEGVHHIRERISKITNSKMTI